MSRSSVILGLSGFPVDKAIAGPSQEHQRGLTRMGKAALGVVSEEVVHPS